MKNQISSKTYLSNKIEDTGFSIIEIILVVIITSIITSISFPIVSYSKNKIKQKEATLIINSLLKAAKSNYAINAFLPKDIKETSKFISFARCNNIDKNLKKKSICYSKNTDKSFYSSSGNYKIELNNRNINNYPIVFEVRAIPNGDHFTKKGSSVVGCFNPINGISLIKEYSFFNPGVQPFYSCLTAEQKRIQEKERLAEEARLLEQKRLAEEARLLEQKRLAEEAKLAEKLKMNAKAKPKCLRFNPRNKSQCLFSE